MFAILFVAASALETPQARIDFLQQRFDASTKANEAWYFGWTVGYAALTVGQGVAILLTSDAELRANLIVGAASTLLGAIFTGILPPPSMTAARKLREFTGTPEAKVAFAEQLMHESADAERFERGWITHALGALVAAAQGLVLWLAFKLPGDGVANALISMHISEAQIYSMPITGKLAEKDYGVHFTAVPGGLGLAGAF